MILSNQTSDSTVPGDAAPSMHIYPPLLPRFPRALRGRYVLSFTLLRVDDFRNLATPFQKTAQFALGRGGGSSKCGHLISLGHRWSGVLGIHILAMNSLLFK